MNCNLNIIITIFLLIVFIYVLFYSNEQFQADNTLYNINNLSNKGPTGPTGPVGPVGPKGSSGSNAIFPKGIIVSWYGILNSVPNGWRICDGSGGTPDLRNRFVIGAGSKYNLNTTGGQETKKLQVTEMPEHSHGYQDAWFAEINGQIPVPGGWGSRSGVDRDNRAFQMRRMTENSGGNNSFSIMNPYYALYYIIKV